MSKSRGTAESPRVVDGGAVAANLATPAQVAAPSPADLRKVVPSDRVVAPRAVKPPSARRSRGATAVSVNPEAILLAAVKQKLDPAAMQQIMDMRRELVAEQARRDYHEAMKGFQAELEPIIKTRVVKNKRERVEAGEAEEERFRYAPIEVIAKKIQGGCDRHGFDYAFDAGRIEKVGENGVPVIPVTIIINHVGGHSERHTFPSPVLFEDGRKIGQSALQCVNGAITFGRRVAMVMGFGIMTADPDPERREGENAKAAEVTQPRSVEQGEPAAKKKPASDDELQAAYDEARQLIKEKASGRAAETFAATASKHLQAGRADLLRALTKSLHVMKRGA